MAFISFDASNNFHCDRVTAFKHSLQDHHLLQLPRLHELAKTLINVGQCKFVRPNLKESSSFGLTVQPPDGRDIDSIFEHIRDPGSWLGLYSIERVSEYRELIREVLESVRPLIESQDPGMFGLGGYVFVSSAPAVTPFHIDRNHNFWMQIHGQKEIYVWDPNDRESVSEEAVERFIVQDDLSLVRFNEDNYRRSYRADVEPGEGIYMPSTAAHMTRSEQRRGSGSSDYVVSLSLTYYTQATRHKAYAYALNHSLRQHGFHPAPLGRKEWRDRIRCSLGQAVVSGRKCLKGYRPPLGM